MTLEERMNASCFKDVVLEIYDTAGTCRIDMGFDELPGIVVSLTIIEEGDMEDE